MAEQAFYNVSSAAKYLGMSRASWDRIRVEWRNKGCNVFEPINTRFTSGPRYHKDQLRIIEGVIIENFTPEEGEEYWILTKSLIGKRK